MPLISVCEEPLAPSKMIARSTIEARIRKIKDLAEGIRSFEFVAQSGAPLPPFAAGSHIDVYLPGGLIRQYSLCNDPAETHRYVVAVLRDPNSRGGSSAMHDLLQPGSKVTISRPRNQFALSKDASYHLFLAGGIGITPIMSMIAAVQARGERFHLYYCTRSPQRTAFMPELRGLIASGQATVHHDGGSPDNALDLNYVLATPQPGAHLYYCGPTGFLDAVERAASDWPATAVHCERFGAATHQPALGSMEQEVVFEVQLAHSGKKFEIPPGKSIVDILNANGIEVDVSCREGYCGTCMTRYLQGQPLHRDSVLDEEDREEFVMICCCRAKGSCLVLDL